MTLAMDALGFGLIVPIVPELVRTLAGSTASGAALPVGALVATFAFAQLVASPVLGSLSDRVGRRPVLLLSIAGVAANYLLLAWAPSLPWLFVGRILSGVTSASVSTATAYIADVTPPEDRAKRFGLVGAMFAFGFVLGPAVGGTLGAIDLRLPFLVSAGLAACNWLYGLLVLPESLPPHLRRTSGWRGNTPLALLRRLGDDPMKRLLGLAWGCMWFGMNVLPTVFVLSMSLRFGWGPRQNGAALAFVGVLGAITQGFLVRRIIRALGERRSAALGCTLTAITYVLFAVAWSEWVVFVAIVVQAGGAVANPSIRALFSNRAGADRQGEAMGSLSAIEGLTSVVSPLLASALFAYFANPAATFHFPGAPFLAGSLAYIAAALLVIRVR